MDGFEWPGLHGCAEFEGEGRERDVLAGEAESVWIRMVREAHGEVREGSVGEEGAGRGVDPRVVVGAQGEVHCTDGLLAHRLLKRVELAQGFDADDEHRWLVDGFDGEFGVDWVGCDDDWETHCEERRLKRRREREREGGETYILRSQDQCTPCCIYTYHSRIPRCRCSCVGM